MPGGMLDPQTGQLRKAWAFVMVLGFSRHQYVEFVWDQSVATWLVLHRHAFEFFGGVPKRIVLDNLKAAITKACWDDPQVQQAYRECAEHYGFLIAPLPPKNTRAQRQGISEWRIHYAGHLAAAPARGGGARRSAPSTAARRILPARCSRPTKAALAGLPTKCIRSGVWKVVTAHRDCYITFENASISVPFRLVGQQLRVRGGAREVRLYTSDFELVTTHVRASGAGKRQTHLDHLPPYKLPGLLLNREQTQAQAAEIGPATSWAVAAFVGRPGGRPLSASRAAGALGRAAWCTAPGSGMCAGAALRGSSTAL